jgi:hypothetical protein
MPAKKTGTKFNPVKSGYDPRKDGSDGTATAWLKIEPNSSVDAVVLVEAEEILACEQCAIWLDAGNSPVWVYTGPDDPSHDLGVDRRYRAYLPVLVDGEVKVWSMGKMAHVQLLDIADASGELKGLEIRIKRTGSGLTTRYSVVPKGKRHDVSRIEEPDVIAMLGPITSEEVREMITEKLGKASYDEVLASYKGSTKRKVGSAEIVDKKSGLKGKPDETEEEESLDSVELR